MAKTAASNKVFLVFPLTANAPRFPARWGLQMGLLVLVMQVVVAGKAQAPSSATSEAEKATKVTVTSSINASTSEKESAKPGATVSLDDLIREALDRNPSVKAAAREVLASRARVPQVRTFPDPVLTTGWAGNITPYSVQRGIRPVIGD